MKRKSNMGIVGKMHLQLWGPDGKLKAERISYNTVTEIGDRHTADQLSDQGEAATGFMAIGTGTGQTSASVGLAVSLDRNALDSTTQGGGGDDNDVIYVASWAAGDGTGAITEAGIFITDDNTSMCFYDDFGTVTKAGADTLTITWTVTFGSS